MRDLVELALSMGRRAAEARMLDTCTIRRPTGHTTDAEGRVTPTYAPVYSGKCRVVDTEGVVTTPEAGGATFTLRRTRIDIPIGSGAIDEGDTVDIDSSATRPDVAGASGRVTSVPVGTQTTAHRLGVEEVS